MKVNHLGQIEVLEPITGEPTPETATLITPSKETDQPNDPSNRNGQVQNDDDEENSSITSNVTLSNNDKPTPYDKSTSSSSPHKASGRGRPTMASPMPCENDPCDRFLVTDDDFEALRSFNWSMSRRETLSDLAFICKLPREPPLDYETLEPSLPTKSADVPAKTLFLDLDETLAHTCLGDVSGKRSPDLIFVSESDNSLANVYFRPWVTDFLRVVSQYYELVLYTASLQPYADLILDELDVEQRFSYRLYREHCTQYGSSDVFFKDLNGTGRNLKDAVVVDNRLISFGLNINNGIFVSSFIGQEADSELLHLLPLLIALSKQDDVRVSLARTYRIEEIMDRYRQDNGYAGFTGYHFGYHDFVNVDSDSSDKALDEKDSEEPAGSLANLRATSSAKPVAPCKEDVSRNSINADKQQVDDMLRNLDSLMTKDELMNKSEAALAESDLESFNLPGGGCIQPPTQAKEDEWSPATRQSTKDSLNNISDQIKSKWGGKMPVTTSGRQNQQEPISCKADIEQHVSLTHYKLPDPQSMGNGQELLEPTKEENAGKASLNSITNMEDRYSTQDITEMWKPEYSASSNLDESDTGTVSERNANIPDLLKGEEGPPTPAFYRLNTTRLSNHRDSASISLPRKGSRASSTSRHLSALSSIPSQHREESCRRDGPLLQLSETQMEKSESRARLYSMRRLVVPNAMPQRRERRKKFVPYKSTQGVLLTPRIETMTYMTTAAAPIMNGPATCSLPSKVHLTTLRSDDVRKRRETLMGRSMPSRASSGGYTSYNLTASRMGYERHDCPSALEDIPRVRACEPAGVRPIMEGSFQIWSEAPVQPYQMPIPQPLAVSYRPHANIHQNANNPNFMKFRYEFDASHPHFSRMDGMA